MSASHRRDEFFRLLLVLLLGDIERGRKERSPVAMLGEVKDHSLNVFLLVLVHLCGKAQEQGDLAGEIQLTGTFP